ncbi:hypothetical protein BDR26DRAFT_918832 [Obelidium mucronatum]|nr:hypothetical protein BDR26DRAFT_918832 [Obelidium mucronatum]
MAFESMLRGLYSSLERLWVKTEGRFTPVLIAVYNVSAIIQALCVVFFLAGAVGEKACFPVGLIGYGVYHIMMVVFGIFFLYRTWYICSNNRVFMVLGAISVLNRIIWSLYDLATSKTYWNTEYGQGYCAMNSNPFAMTGYLVSDMATDILCTLATGIVSISYFSSDLRKLFLVMIVENIVRSVFVLPIQVASVWCTLNALDSTVANVIASVEIYVLTQAVNSEFFMFKIRNAALDESIRGEIELNRIESENRVGVEKS